MLQTLLDQLDLNLIALLAPAVLAVDKTAEEESHRQKDDVLDEHGGEDIGQGAGQGKLDGANHADGGEHAALQAASECGQHDREEEQFAMQQVRPAPARQGREMQQGDAGDRAAMRTFGDLCLFPVIEYIKRPPVTR